MKYSKYVALFLAMLLFVLCAGCARQGIEQPAATQALEQPTSAPEFTPITVTDMSGREVVLKKTADRIVVLSAADCEILYALGAGDKVVGRGAYCDYPAQVEEVPLMQSGEETNLEQIIALEPQLVIMSKMAQTQEHVGALTAAGVPVFSSDAQSIADVYTNIELLGKLTGKNQEASALVEGMKAAFADVSANAADGSKSIYFEVSPLAYGLWTAGSGTFMDEVAAMLGVKNAFADIQGWGQISEEQVLERNPDYIVTIAMYYGEGLPPMEEIMAREGWATIAAVKNNAVFNADADELSRPGPRLADAAKMLGDFLRGQGQ